MIEKFPVISKMEAGNKIVFLLSRRVKELTRVVMITDNEIHRTLREGIDYEYAKEAKSIIFDKTLYFGMNIRVYCELYPTPKPERAKRLLG